MFSLQAKLHGPLRVASHLDVIRIHPTQQKLNEDYWISFVLLSTQYQVRRPISNIFILIP